IAFYENVKKGLITPAVVSEFLRVEGGRLSASGGDYYYEVRDRFNSAKDPLDFLFLSRSCFNGLIRFNRDGLYNVPFGRKPERFSRSYITKICNQVKWISRHLRGNDDWTIACMDFGDAISEAGPADLIYCDPPYVGRHVDYFDSWSEDNEIQLSKALRRSGGRFILSTWLGNRFRKNRCVEEIWSGLRMVTREHFYHVGAKETNRNSMTEALITNCETPIRNDQTIRDQGQMELFQTPVASAG
ncbi:MAG: Dam family site-specific DNA-(adenine-N6)-methyltransferase, partial [Candidatus Coatesbacteria bacterium]|nr:Dam family site-specific DNA-(adenine-N6)-methyltransferase [Candidatus Coatesbacteria bacterium]